MKMVDTRFFIKTADYTGWGGSYRSQKRRRKVREPYFGVGQGRILEILPQKVQREYNENW